jgi:hypothetical protein
MSEEATQTDDKELLELAAKAAGFTLEEHYDDDQYYPWCTETLAFWNPLLDDGDAFRLAAKLGLELRMSSEFVIVVIPRYTDNEAFEPKNDDPYAATRRAIVRAAAEIGKEMK